MGFITRPTDPVRVPAKQEFAKECDINHIMKRALSSGQFPTATGWEPVFADVSEIGDYADTLRRVDAARDAFATLPAPVRSRFSNRPDELIAFLSDVSNRDEAVKLGLIAAPDPAPAAAAPAAAPVP